MAKANSSSRTRPSKQANPTPVSDAASYPPKGDPTLRQEITNLFDDLERIRDGLRLAVSQAAAFESDPGDRLRMLLNMALGYCQAMDNSIDVLRAALDLPAPRGMAESAASAWLAAHSRPAATQPLPDTSISTSTASTPAESAAHKTYTQADIWDALGGPLQCDVADGLLAMYDVAHQARASDGSAEAALLVVERFAREAFLDLDDALESVGFDRMERFDGREEVRS